MTLIERDESAPPALVFRGVHRIDDLTVRSIGADELPDVSKYLEALARIPPEKRVGKVPVPELKPGPHDEEVSVSFFK